MRLLLICPFASMPPRTGAAVRAVNLARVLGPDVWALAPSYANVPRTAPPEPPAGLRYAEVGPARWHAQFVNPTLVRRGVALVRKHDIGAVLSTAYQGGLSGLLTARLAGKPFVYDAHNVEHERFARMHRPGVARALRAYERLLVRGARLVSGVSREDLAGIRRLGVPDDRLVLAPNAYDPRIFRFQPAAGASIRRTLGVADAEPLVVFVGKLDYPPNRQAVGVITDVIAPLLAARSPQGRIAIVGAHPSRVGPPNVVFTDVVDDVAAHLAAADAVVVPLASGGGTKFKVIEALACGKPVVTTPIGAEGLPQLDAMHVAPTPEACGPLLLEVLQHARYDASPSRSTQEALAAFTWEAATAELRARLQQLFEGRR